MKKQIFIGNIYKVTKEDVHFEKERTINNSGIDALVCGENYGIIPACIWSFDSKSELYKQNALLIKISDEFDLISRYAEIIEIKNNKIIIDKKTILSVPYGLNTFFVDENSLQSCFHKSKNCLIRTKK